MQAFKNDKKLKKMLLDEIVRHRKADLLRQGAYKRETDGKFRFCAVGCAVETFNVKLGKSYANNDHSAYETELEIPRQLAYLEDRIFEKLPKEKAMLWPEKFIAAIPVGADLSLVVAKFLFWLMGNIKKFAKKNTRILEAIEGVKKLYGRKLKGETITNEEWIEARKIADADAAAYAADAAVDAAYAAAYAADAAYADAADAAVDAADAAAYAAYAADAAFKKQFKKMADKLLELLKNSKRKSVKKLVSKKK